MQMIKVDSSNILEIGYNLDSQSLYISFKGSKPSIYEYSFFSQESYEAFLKAESKGRFFDSEIKGNYEFKKTKSLQEHLPKEAELSA